MYYLILFFSLNRVKEQAAKEVMEKERALKEKEEEVSEDLSLPRHCHLSTSMCIQLAIILFIHQLRRMQDMIAKMQAQMKTKS